MFRNRVVYWIVTFGFAYIMATIFVRVMGIGEFPSLHPFGLKDLLQYAPFAGWLIAIFEDPVYPEITGADYFTALFWEAAAIVIAFILAGYAIFWFAVIVIFFLIFLI